MNQDLDKVAQVATKALGQDVTTYDQTFLGNCLATRQSATGCRSLDAYLKYLTQNPSEAVSLRHSLNISYSEFFRNPLTFAMLEQAILPSLIVQKQQTARAEIRIWSAGCAAGQEPYSVAILLDELIEARNSTTSFRIFATDRSATVLETAQKGMYSKKSVQRVQLKHIHKYFSKSSDTYSLAPAIKDRVSFTAYDLLEEDSLCPPVSIYGEFDIVFCSNVLLYYRPEIRTFILRKLRRCLPPDGYLITDTAERDIVVQHREFRTVVGAAPVYRRV